MKTLLVALISIGWIGCGPFLTWFMSKRRYDALSWLAVGLVAGPSALAIASLERRGWAPPLPEVVVRGKDGRGAVNILVVVVDDADVVPVARPLVEWFGDCVGRLTVVRVLQEGGPLDERAHAARAIKEVVGRMEPFSAHGVLLFGRQEAAIRAHLSNEPVHVVITAGPHHAVSQALTGTDVLHVDGPQYEDRDGSSARHEAIAGAAKHRAGGGEAGTPERLVRGRQRLLQ